MSKLNITKLPSATALELGFEGPVDEDAVLPPLELNGVKTVSLDLGKVSTMNSCGIREWLNWIKPLATTVSLILKNCPKIIVDQMNMIHGFLPPGAKVESFEVPYYCEKCGESPTVLFREGEHFSGAKVEPRPSTPCPKCQEPAEMDVVGAKYFRFLKV